MAKENIYDKSFLYSILRVIWTDWKIRHSYRKAEIRGLENIPDDGSSIICPNHCNTLMDALVILRSRKGPTVFGARADIFKKPFIARLMYFFRILPMVRRRDGLRNVLQNNDTQEIIVRTLEHDVPFCLFPEGTHRVRHSLQQLGKGAFRIALAANEKFGRKKPVYLVPVGIEYGDYFRYRSTCLVNYGSPINVTEFLNEGNFESEPQAVDALRKVLSHRMSELITYIPDDENYDAKWALLKMVNISNKKKGYGDFGSSLYDSMLENRTIARQIDDIVEKDPENSSRLLERVRNFEEKRKKCGVSIYSFRKAKLIPSIISKGIAAILGLAYFIFSAIVALPMLVLETAIRKSVKDPAFKNTVSLGIKLALGTVLSIIYAALAYWLAPWWLATILFVLWLPSFSYFHDYMESCRRWVSDIRLSNNKDLLDEFKSIIEDYKNLA